MVPTAWIYSIQFKFWSPQLHQQFRLHSTCHINNKTYPLTPDWHWLQYLHLCILYRLLDSCNLYKQMSSSLHFVYATLYTTTFPVYSLLTTSTRYWIITNASTTDTTWPSYSLLRYLLQFPLIITLVLFYVLSCFYSPRYLSTQNRLHWYGHVLWKEDNDWVKDVWIMKWRVQDQEVDQRGLGERWCQ